jgi:hypothetical protein
MDRVAVGKGVELRSDAGADDPALANELISGPPKQAGRVAPVLGVDLGDEVVEDQPQARSDRRVGPDSRIVKSDDRPVLHVVDRSPAKRARGGEPEGIGERQRRFRGWKVGVEICPDGFEEFGIDENVHSEMLFIINDSNYLWVDAATICSVRDGADRLGVGRKLAGERSAQLGRIDDLGHP